MVDMPAEAEALIAALYTVSAVAVSSIGLPQTISLFRRWRSGDGLHLFRFLWVLLMGALCLGMLYRAAVWVDLAAFDQLWMGPLAQRWPLEVGIALLVTFASLFAAWLYWHTRGEIGP